MEDKEGQQTFIINIRKGDRQAITKLYELAFQYCASFVTKNSGTQEDAKDIFQEALFALIKKLRTEDFTIEHDVKAYLYVITRNLWLKKLRTDKKKGLQLIMDEPDSPIQLITEEEWPEKKVLEARQQKLYTALQQLKEACRQLLTFTFFEKLGDQAIANKMGYAYTFVPQKRRRCIASLKAIMIK